MSYRLVDLLKMVILAIKQESCFLLLNLSRSQAIKYKTIYLEFRNVHQGVKLNNENSFAITSFEMCILLVNEITIKYTEK